MEDVISKSKFKPRALRYFRQVEKTGKPLVITDRGKRVLTIVPYLEDPADALKALRNSVLRYNDPTAPIGLDDWESLK
jgi:prevent-host-death family protein